ncbi:hypothetical protein SeMB42_g06079 [Synchytrium endobioticum]|uniref:Uncharacterized protein n=1 Tax=Synchytrium endobioticum TaxID=286115 RepID=A0A507CGG2_9FUNG|nr:hypothetical protein SeMB42_g06079 [Synchytrium endobioticum]
MGADHVLEDSSIAIATHTHNGSHLSSANVADLLPRRGVKAPSARCSLPGQRSRQSTPYITPWAKQEDTNKAVRRNVDCGDKLHPSNPCRSSELPAAGAIRLEKHVDKYTGSDPRSCQVPATKNRALDFSYPRFT